MAPVDLSISDLKSRSFHLSWNPPPTEDTNGIIRKYTVKLMEVLTEREELLETSNTTMRIHSLKPYTMYSVSVSAFTVSSGPFTPVVKVDTLEDGRLLILAYALVQGAHPLLQWPVTA